MPTMGTQLNIAIDADLREQVRRKARGQGLTVSDAVCEVLRLWVGDDEQPVPTTTNNGDGISLDINALIEQKLSTETLTPIVERILESKGLSNLPSTGLDELSDRLKEIPSLKEGLNSLQNNLYRMRKTKLPDIAESLTRIENLLRNHPQNMPLIEPLEKIGKIVGELIDDALTETSPGGGERLDGEDSIALTDSTVTVAGEPATPKTEDLLRAVSNPPTETESESPVTSDLDFEPDSEPEHSNLTQVESDSRTDEPATTQSENLTVGQTEPKETNLSNNTHKKNELQDGLNPDDDQSQGKEIKSDSDTVSDEEQVNEILKLHSRQIDEICRKMSHKSKVIKDKYDQGVTNGRIRVSKGRELIKAYPSYAIEAYKQWLSEKN